MPKKLYIKICVKLELQRYKWIILILTTLLIAITVYTKALWLGILTIVCLLAYLGFIYFVFYGSTLVPQNSLLFSKYTYDISDEQIVMMLDARRGIPINWDKIKKCVKWKDKYVMQIARGHIMIIPFSIFKNKMEMNIFDIMLKNKKLYPND